MQRPAADPTTRRPTMNEDLRDSVREKLKRFKISMGQIDLNGLCNAGCWFCPVKYEGNPKEFATQMSLEHLDLVLRRVRESSVAGSFPFIYTSHYNEFLLYKQFEESLDVFRRHKFSTMVLSNGTTITPEKTDAILRNRDVIDHIALNIPSIDRLEWSKKAGVDPKLFRNLLRNLDYLHDNQDGLRVVIQINAMTNAAEVLEGGFASSPEQVRELESRFRENYPRFNFSMVTALVDRAGRLPTIKNARAIMMPGEKVVGCGHSSTHDSGSRIYGWLHVNPKGDVFLCCDDYSMEYTFGNLLTQSLDEIWLSERHVDTILKAFGELCTKCQNHKVGTAAQPGASRLRQRTELFTVFSAGVRGPELKLLPAAPGPAREREPA